MVVGLEKKFPTSSGNQKSVSLAVHALARKRFLDDFVRY